jgi:8-oxo-dGTP diphosphatase
MTRTYYKPYDSLDPKIPVVAVDLAVFTIVDRQLHVLLIQMKKKPYAGLWALPGGLIKPGESLDEAAKEELADKTGVKNVYLEQLYTFGDIKRDRTRRAISTAYFALVDSSKLAIRTTEKYSDIRWFPVAKLSALAYDHAKIIAYAARRLRWKLEYTNIAWSLLPAAFTLTDLQTVYESIIGKKLDKRNFRKKILSLKLVESTGKTDKAGAHRPAELFRFRTRIPSFVEVL